jgi:hypothetical protein
MNPARPSSSALTVGPHTASARRSMRRQCAGLGRGRWVLRLGLARAAQLEVIGQGLGLDLAQRLSRARSSAVPSARSHCQGAREVTGLLPWTARGW